mmetsp:Transcript_15528/g.22751  ORF Transcript_15528/g.22751 Transcript_15528/m.22751 type:complete len:250 (-) Transcript_15528:45-794(-)
MKQILIFVICGRNNDSSVSKEQLKLGNDFVKKPIFVRRGFDPSSINKSSDSKVVHLGYYWQSESLGVESMGELSNGDEGLNSDDEIISINAKNVVEGHGNGIPFLFVGPVGKRYRHPSRPGSTKGRILVGPVLHLLLNGHNSLIMQVRCRLDDFNVMRSQSEGSIPEEGEGETEDCHDSRPVVCEDVHREVFEHCLGDLTSLLHEHCGPRDGTCNGEGSNSKPCMRPHDAGCLGNMRVIRAHHGLHRRC